MLIVLLATLIVYGLTLILVQGTIFNKLKKSLGQHNDKLDKFLHPNDEEIHRMITKKDPSADLELIKIHNEIEGKFYKTDPSDPNFEKLTALYSQAKVQIKQRVCKNRHSYLDEFRLWCGLKLAKLSECMMCMGFWVGLIVSLLPLLYNISICGVSLVLITTTGHVNIALAAFLLACMFSGTTWIINSVVDLCFELKENLGNFIHRG